MLIFFITPPVSINIPGLIFQKKTNFHQGSILLGNETDIKKKESREA